MNTKSPVGMAVPVLAATTAVKVTGWFTVVGLADEVRLVMVPTGCGMPVGRVIVSVSSVTAAVQPASGRPRSPRS
jgi:hypothetical protein